MTVMAKINQFKEIYNIGIIGWRCNVCLVNNKYENKLCVICKRPNTLELKVERTAASKAESTESKKRSKKPNIVISTNSQDAFSSDFGSNSENIDPTKYFKSENMSNTKSVDVSVHKILHPTSSNNGSPTLKFAESLQAYTACGFTKIEAIKLKFFLEQNASLQVQELNKKLPCHGCLCLFKFRITMMGPLAQK